MSIIEIFILAVIQGLTEFLPISSSGHLVILPHLLKWKDQGLDMDIALHTGTLLAVLLYFRVLIKNLVVNSLVYVSKGFQNSHFNNHVKLSLTIVIATIPSILIGFFIKDLGLNTRHVPLIAWALILFGILLYIADRWGRKNKDLSDFNIKNGLIVGLFQIFAFIPGASRSGVCLTAARMLGFERADAARFAFLLSIPVILGATTLSFLKLDFSNLTYNWQDLFWGISFSFIVGVASIHFMLRFLTRYSMGIFTLYRVLMGLFLLAYF